MHARSILLLPPLLLAALTIAVQAQTPAKSYANFPTGEGDPTAITCRPPQPMPESRFIGPEVCKPNAVWARYRRDGMDIAADGLHDEPLRKGGGVNCETNVASTGNAGAVAMTSHCN
jgi:hypothetical protein